MSYFPSSWTPVRLHFTRGKSREIVVKEKLVVTRMHRAVTHLLVHFELQGTCRHRLGFAPGKYGGSMGGWKIIHYRPDGSDFIQLPAIQPFLFIQGQIAGCFLMNLVEIRPNQAFFKTM